MPPPDSVRFPIACPACSAVCATPSMVSQADGVTVVIIRCNQCKQEFRLESDASADPVHMRSGVRLPLVKPPKEKP